MNNDNNSPTPEEIAKAISSFATTAIGLHEAKILSDDNITKANAIFGDFLDKVKAKVDSLDFTKQDNQNQNNVPPAPMPPINTTPMPPMDNPTNTGTPPMPPMPPMDNNPKTPPIDNPVVPPVDTPPAP